MLLWQQDTPKQGFIHGWLFGFAMFGSGLSWIHVSVSIYGNINIVPAIAITLALAAILAIYPAITGAIAASGKNISPTQRQLILIPSLWVLAEWLRARCLSGFSWLTPGYSQVDSPLSSLMPLGGTLLVLAALTITAGLLVLTIQNKKPHNIACIMIIWIGAMALTPLQWTKAEGQPQKTALVQGAIKQELKWRPEYLEHTKQLYNKITTPLWNTTDLVVWPEAVIPAFYHQVQPYLEDINRKRENTSLLLGIPTYNKKTDKFHNSVITLQAQELPEPGQVYHKRHLVPFGEYVPLQKLLTPILKKLNIPYSEFSGGNGTTLLPSPAGSAGIMVCYEIIFAHTVLDKLPQAKILINVSNDAWFGDSTGPHQHLQIARTRAKETGRYILRATNNGISAIINPQGKILARSQQFKAEAIQHEVTAMTGSTPYTVLGDTPIAILALLLSALLLWRIRSTR